MTAFQAVGFTWVLLTSLIGTALIFWAAFAHVRATLENALRGEIEKNRDVARALAGGPR